MPENDNGHEDAKVNIDGPVMKDEKETQTEEPYEAASGM